MGYPTLWQHAIPLLMPNAFILSSTGHRRSFSGTIWCHAPLRGVEGGEFVEAAALLAEAPRLAI